ncbi:uncharacterized protein LOC130782567 [Actinidia eriantha]|uniref:uncharacterized protein LOC130782567 n=1 Tax=Actinidia eriantha TaxID=165200 RepID=UPI00258B843F|nr:uncharacterized protein LOC130782567 [Actinidia eriantha]
MNPMDAKKDTVTIRAVSKGEEGRKKVEKLQLNPHKIETIKYIEKKLVDKGVQRMERRPADGLPLARPPPKSGHGGKYTWEGPVNEAEAELHPTPAAVDERDPNYVDETEEERAVRGDDE